MKMHWRDSHVLSRTELQTVPLFTVPMVISKYLFLEIENCLLYSNDGNITDHFDDSAPYHGFFYEIDHVNACLIRNQFESKIMPLSLSLEILDFMDKVRNKMELTYPFE